MNVVTLDGNVVDPGELKKVSEDSRVRNIRMARNQAEGKPSMFLDVEVWDGWAENFRGKKGDPVVVTGELRQSHWESDGESRSKFYLRAREVKLLERKPVADLTQ